MRRYGLPFMLLVGLSACAWPAPPARPPLGASLILDRAPAVSATVAASGSRAAVALPDLPLVPRLGEGKADKATVEAQIKATQGVRVGELPAAPALTRAGVTLGAAPNALGAFGGGLGGGLAEVGLGVASPAQRAGELRAHPTIVAESPVLGAQGAAGYRLAALPDDVDLRPELPAVRDQGQRPTGLFFAVAAAADHLYRDDPVMPIKQASPQFMAWLHQVRLVGQVAPQALWGEAGASLDLFHLALRAEGHYEKPAVPAEQGYVGEADAPYPAIFFAASSPTGVTPPDMARRYLGEGLAARLVAGERVATQGIDLKPVAADLETLRAVLASARCVVLSLPVHPADWSPVAPDWRVGELSSAEVAGVGYQAVLLVGYETDAAAPGGGWFIVRNSWGERWADAGHARLSFQYVRDFGFAAYAPERYDRPFIAAIPLTPSDGKVVSPLPAPPKATPRPTVVRTPAPRATPKPTPKPATPTPKPTVKPSATPTPKPSAEPTASPTPAPTASPTPQPSPTPTASPTAAPTPTPTPTPEPTATPGEATEREQAQEAEDD